MTKELEDNTKTNKYMKTAEEIVDNWFESGNGKSMKSRRQAIELVKYAQSQSPNQILRDALEKIGEIIDWMKFCDEGYAKRMYLEDVQLIRHYQKQAALSSHVDDGYKFNAIHLVRLGDQVYVNMEVNKEWVTLITEYYDCPFSHIIGPLGIQREIEKQLPKPPTQ